jgi:hypothetical protein
VVVVNDDKEFWARIYQLTGETEEQAKARIFRETEEAHSKSFLRLTLDLTMTYEDASDEYWLRSAGPDSVSVQQADGSWSAARLTDPDGERPGISWKFSAKPGSGYFNFGTYARLAKLADEHGAHHGYLPNIEEVENAPSIRLRDRGFFSKCPSCGYTKK